MLSMSMSMDLLPHLAHALLPVEQRLHADKHSVQIQPLQLGVGCIIASVARARVASTLY